MPQCVLNVHNLPRSVNQSELAGSAVIVIDLLRATTTITQALASGAREVVPFLEVEETLAAAEKVGRENVVLGGERGGARIPGFDLGNSPSEYTPAAVGGRRVFITTTNGTRALDHARLARRVIVGAMVNLSAVVESVIGEQRIDILCAGTNGAETREDTLAGGVYAARMAVQSQAPLTMNESATGAAEQWRKVLAAAVAANRSIDEQLALELRSTQGGRNLLGIGLERDLIDAARVDRLRVVPELDVRAWKIRLP